MAESDASAVPDFQALFDAAPDRYLVLDRQFVIVAVSAAYTRATMTRREDIIGRNVFEVFPDNPSDPAAEGAHNLRASLVRVLHSATADSMPVQKYDIRRDDGDAAAFEERYWSPLNTPVMGADGKVAFIIHRVEDVTELVRVRRSGAEQSRLNVALREQTRRMETEVFARSREVAATSALLKHANEELSRLYKDADSRLQRLEQSFRATFEQAAVGIAHIAPDGRWLRVNQKLCEILGYSREELLCLSFQDITCPDDLHADLARVDKVLSGEIRTCTSEKRYLHHDGHLVWINLTISLVRDAGGRPEYFIAVIEDIARRKQAEDRLRLQAMVFNSVQEGIVITDEEGGVIDVNPAFERSTEYSLEEVRGRNMGIVQSGRQDRSFYQQMWRSILETGNWQGEIWNRRKSGDIYLEWISISVVHDDTGRVTNYVGVAVDISRMHHPKSELERMAHHDALTDLPNRLLLMSRLEHAIERFKRNAGVGAVLFIDLDCFKQVNDTLGHKAGDDLLQAVAIRLKGRLREIDTLARLGGDEFVIVLDEIPEPDAAAAIARELIDQLHTPFALPSGNNVRIGGSVGIAVFPQDGECAATLIEHADRALYSAKSEGRGRYRFFAETQPAKKADR